MRAISPTLVAVFLAGICVGSFGHQILEIARGWTNAPATDLSSLPIDGPPSPRLEPGGAAFLADLRAQQGSVLAGSSLETEQPGDENLEFAAALRDVQRSADTATTNR